MLRTHGDAVALELKVGQPGAFMEQVDYSFPRNAWEIKAKRGLLAMTDITLSPSKSFEVLVSGKNAC